MTAGSNTNAELIAIANATSTNDVIANPRRYRNLIGTLANALQAAEQRAEEAERERDNWKMSAEEAERVEKRWLRRASLAERERDRLDEAFDRDLPWRYDEVEDQRNQLAAVVEKAEDYVTRHYLDTRFGGEVLPMLATDPADALREHDAALIEGLADDLDSALYEDIPHGSSIRFHYEAWLRDQARQRREERA